jgi:hypothetical protein
MKHHTMVLLCGSNLSLADTSVAGGMHLPFTYNAMRGYLLPSGFWTRGL